MILQANIVGYLGTPATVVGYLDVSEQRLYIKAVGKLRQERFQNPNTKEQAGFISNVPTDDYDYFFSERDFGQAFRYFKEYDGSGHLIFDPTTVRARPVVEMNKITETGTDYAISPDTTNEQVAIIALCFFAKSATQAECASALYDELSAFFTV